MFNRIRADLVFIAKNKGLNCNLVNHLRCALSPSFICSSLYRTSHKIHTLKIPILAKVFWWINFILFKVDIDYRAKLCLGIYMPHPIGIVIGDGVYSSANLKIMQGSTLGGSLGQSAIFDGTTIKQPHFLADSFIGINSVIVGPLIFEDSIFVAANSTITKQIESGFLYGSNKQKPLNTLHKESLFI
ncbi:hypothetical protein [Pseudomonas versuta]|uniref:Serine acetyltransferase n=1 Tax=Pseudomonas versuta TaxID=1788301 RepID=A0ABX3EAF8_9PSED|nr:hypothetical protein [Pseudomonas versuta]OKA22397.1 hypothetical protein BOH73_08180 [Pseudomonas versuta]